MVHTSLFRKNISIKRLTQGKLPSLPFVRMKEIVLGKRYELSIVFAGRKLSQKLNKKYRGKNKPTNILSFSISKTSGEIIISLEQVRKEAPQFNKKYTNHLGFLLIHGMLHLKGYGHGKRMEAEEKKFCQKFLF